MPLPALPELVRIPAGDFLMGADTGGEDEGPAHVVSIDAFEMGVHPVTVAQYARFVRETGHRTPGVHELPLIVTTGGRDREQAFRATAGAYAWSGDLPEAERQDHPVTLVRWEDAAAYCAWLSTLFGRPVRLPTEAEWEYAARAGTRQRFPWGDALDPSRANFLLEPQLRQQAGTTAVTRYPPNGFGLHDMIGNVWEWVADWYAPDASTRSRGRNAKGAPRGTMRLVRGGGWPTTDPQMLSCSYRHKVPPDTYSYSIGFRVAAGLTQG